MKNEYFSLYSEIPLLLLDEEILLAGKKKRGKANFLPYRRHGRRYWGGAWGLAPKTEAKN